MTTLNADCPEFEVSRDPKETAAGVYLTMDESTEIQPDGDWIEHARRISGFKDLFVYRHRDTGRYMLCKWLWHPRETTSPMAMELHGMDESPEIAGPHRPTGDVLRAMLSPDYGDSSVVRKNMNARAERKRRLKDERMQSRKEAARHLHNQGDWDGAKALASGAVPWAAPSECSGQLADQVSTLSKIIK